MQILPLITYPNPILKEVSKSVNEVDDNLRNLMKNMVATMYNERGIGLAAVQIGQLKRVLVMDLNYEPNDNFGNSSNCDISKIKNSKPRYFVNPEIIESSSETSSYKEGCLSFPGIRSEIIRPKKVTVKYLDYDGKEQIEEMDELFSTCIQHEIDHLNGIVFVDYISKLKRDMLLKKVKKYKKNH